MKNSKPKVYESIKVSKEVVDKVRVYKEISGVSISSFFEKAANNYFANPKSKKA